MTDSILCYKFMLESFTELELYIFILNYFITI